jgi:hypothetical protein
MSKKLIAVASAAALALSALVAMPSVATPGVAGVGPFQVQVTGNEVTNQVNRTGGTAANALRVFVPSGDVLRSTPVVTGDSDGDELPRFSNTALRVNIQTPGATDAITITATGGVEVVTDTQWGASTAPTTATGVQSLTVAAAQGDATVYAYTTSTATGTLVVSAAGSSQTIFIQGISNVATNAYKLSFTGSASSALGGTIAVTGTVRDMFDNLLTPTAANLKVTTMGGSLTGADATPSDFLVNATTSVVSFTVPSSTTASQVAVSVAAVNPPIAYTAFPGRNVTSFFLTNAVNLATAVTALEAQVATLKADYNALAERWNKRVASKKAPKKAVTLK